LQAVLSGGFDEIAALHFVPLAMTSRFYHIISTVWEETSSSASFSLK
jgi:hypothetical protein